MKKTLGYRELANYYDKIYSFKEYKKEAENIKELIRKYKKSSGNKLLDLACGTGNHLQYFTEDYDCFGLDLHEGMLKIAQEKIPSARFIQANMKDFRIDQQFDVIISLFSSIGYILTKKELLETFKTISNHLVKGGLVIIEPWLEPSEYGIGGAHMTTFEDGNDLKIARLNISERKGDIAHLEMHWLIAERDVGVKHFTDVHQLALFSRDILIDYMKNSGLEVHLIKEDIYTNRDILIGIKQ